MMESNVRNITIGVNDNNNFNPVDGPIDGGVNSVLTTLTQVKDSSTNVQSANVVIGNLSPFRRYVVTIQSKNAVGTSDPSSPVTFVTDEEAPGGPPLNLQLAAIDANSVKVRDKYFFDTFVQSSRTGQTSDRTLNETIGDKM